MRFLWQFGADTLDTAKDRLPKIEGGTVGFLKNVLSWVFGLIGVISVVMIIYSGLQMAASAGDAGAVTKAKNTMIYAIVGLVVSILAFAIVQFVLKEVG